MNTKHKIKGIQELVEALHNYPAILVIGSFDPLHAVHTERLNQISRPMDAKLVAAITDPQGTVLSHLARLEMTAALRMVDFVLPYETGIESAFRWVSVHDDTLLHDRWSADFKENVRRRSQSASA